MLANTLSSVHDDEFGSMAVRHNSLFTMMPLLQHTLVSSCICICY
jgi:hypothetical protein